jgi:hypothetical protein
MKINELKQQFIELGFIVIPIPELLHHIPSLLNSFENLISSAENLGSKGLVKIRASNLENVNISGMSWGCDHIFSPELLKQDLLDIASLEPIPFIVRSILGDKVRWTAGHGHWSPKNGDYYLHWHRDTRRNLWKQGVSNSHCHIQVCVALKDESVIWIVPSSHLRNLDEWEYKYIEESDKYSVHPYQIIPKIPAGSALFFNTYLLHRAECSKSNIRRAIHFGFTKVDTNVSESYRLGKNFDWLADKNFFDVQSPFLQKCIQEQIIWQTMKTSKFFT